MTAPDLPPAPVPVSLDDLRLELDTFKQAIVERLEMIDARLLELEGAEATRRERVVSMLTGALAAVRESEKDDAE